MSEIANSEAASDSEKPVPNDGVEFPPFPGPKDDDFDEDIGEEERKYYRTVFKDLNAIKNMRLHCSACDRHLGCSPRNEVRMRAHPMLRTLVCHNCHIFYNSGEFEKGDDGSELYCRWCGQGGQVYCCSDCPHVFCAKCIKRNLGVTKIKEIENADDWKCFKCNSKCLWDLRALCWAVLRYCDLKNKMAYQAQDPELKEAYKKDCAIDYSTCCKTKTKRTQKIEKEMKKKEIKKEADAKTTANIISKIPPTIQVKKFATVNMDEIMKPDKKPHKRSLSPKSKVTVVKNPINIAPCTKLPNPIGVPPLAKKMRLPNPSMLTPVRLLNPINPMHERKQMATYTRIRPKPPPPGMPIINNSFNGFSANIYSNVINDNINLSLDSLTQGLDMAAVAAISQNNCQDDDVVCTPDFPLEPLCEVTEDNDDDVQCITPGPVVPPKVSNPPPLVPRSGNNMTSEVTSDNIIQMTENDVTVNAATGGLKFRVDPQTLSSNKMYRLPDGRIFAINANPNMPGGYSATIVAVTEPASNKVVPKGPTYAAKLNAVSSSSPVPKTSRIVPRILKRSTPKTAKVTRSTETSSRECDLNVPVEWYRYNLIDAVDALEYALSRLHKLKKEATTVYLRTRTVSEMRNLHRTLERLLNTSSSRFGEIRDNLNKELKQYISRKSGGNTSEDDDDVEILPDMENDDPIFIDENSMESSVNESQEVDLTGAGSSEYNDSGENTKDNNFSKNDIDPLKETVEHGDVMAVLSNNHNFMDTTKNQTTNVDGDKNGKNNLDDNNTSILKKTEMIENGIENETQNNVGENEMGRAQENENPMEIDKYTEDTPAVKIQKCETDTDGVENEGVSSSPCNQLKCNETIDGVNGEVREAVDNVNKVIKTEESGKCMVQENLLDKADSQDSDDKLQDPEMSEELIETLLKDDNAGDESNSASTLKNTDVAEVLQET